MEKLKIKDLKKDLFIGDFGYDFVDYSDGCICDIITEITEEQNNKLLNGFEFDNNNETLENLIDFINEIMKVSVND